ncbi:MAG: aminotransferase class III-fold pyridoxal phosphate-dependent enzyme [Gemmatimonadaceae bacterium]
MPFRRLFGRDVKPPAQQEPNETLEPATDVQDASDEPEEQDREYDPAQEDVAWRARALVVIPGGTSTGSKRPSAVWGTADPDAELASHFVRARGCRIVTPAERTLIDCTMALGSVALGYGDEQVLHNALNHAALGSIAGLPHVTEVELAERLCDSVPCAEQVRFFKTGADAVSAALRVARVATGRSRVVCSGYFGWHDWSNAGPGVPQGATTDVQHVPFDDVAALERACAAAGNDLAAVVLEPVVERLPSEQWITTARSLCTRASAVLVFDEIKTGFRLRTAGYQEYAGVEPDLATLGKALANGFPLAALVGRAALMEAAQDTWISSTLAGESIAIAAALAVVDRFERDDVSRSLWSIGDAMMTSLRTAIRSSGLTGVAVEGLAPMWFLRFDDALVERTFLARAAHHGVLFKRGPYNYPALAHDSDTLAAIEAAASSAMVEVAEQLREPARA